MLSLPLSVSGSGKFFPHAKPHGAVVGLMALKGLDGSNFC
jgi:hypothetical protein